MDVFGNTPRSSSDFEDFHFRLAKRNLDWSSRKSCFSGCCAPPYIYYGLKILPENWAFSLHYIPNVYNTQKRLGSVGPCLATLASLAREDIRSRMREQLFSPVFLFVCELVFSFEQLQIVPFWHDFFRAVSTAGAPFPAGNIPHFIVHSPLSFSSLLSHLYFCFYLLFMGPWDLALSGL